MKVYKNNSTSGSRNKKVASKRGKGISSTLVSIIFVIAILVIATFLCINYRISLKQEIEELRKQNIRVHREIRKLKRETVNLKIKQETLKRWDYVKMKIKFFDLKLREPNAGQVRDLVIHSVEEKKYKFVGDNRDGLVLTR